MPSLVTNPNNLTKEKLKAELQKFNIPLPSSDSRKDVYVELYRDKILNADRLEFSSDDEALSATPKRLKKKPSTPKHSPSKKLSKKATIEAEDEEMEVDSLTDAELASKLRELGVDVGPIINSTRKVYRRKLQRLLDEENSQPDSIFTNSTQILEQEFSDPDETEVKEVYESVTESSHTVPNYTSPTLETYRRRNLRDSPFQITKSSSRTSPKRPVRSYYADEVDSGLINNRHVEKENHYSREVTSRITKPKAADIISQAKEESVQKQKKGISIWVQLVIIAIVAVIIFLIIQNMEPANKNPVGKLTTEP